MPEPDPTDLSQGHYIQEMTRARDLGHELQAAHPGLPLTRVQLNDLITGRNAYPVVYRNDFLDSAVDGAAEEWERIYAEMGLLGPRLEDAAPRRGDSPRESAGFSEPSAPADPAAPERGLTPDERDEAFATGFAAQEQQGRLGLSAVQIQELDPHSGPETVAAMLAGASAAYAQIMLQRGAPELPKSPIEVLQHHIEELKLSARERDALVDALDLVLIQIPFSLIAGVGPQGVRRIQEEILEKRRVERGRPTVWDHLLESDPSPGSDPSLRE